MVKRKVTKDEFDKFINDYPNKLYWDTTGICEPPVTTANDFIDGKIWPESVVASITRNTMMEGHPVYKGEPDDYYVWEGLIRVNGNREHKT